MTGAVAVAEHGLLVWTLGHSSRSWEEFLALLHAQRIELVADVRRFAGSRRYPQFGPDHLPAGLEEHEIDYLALEELGGRRKPRADSTHTIWRNTAFRAYADYMETPDYLLGRERLVQEAGCRRTAMLCSEALWWRCHRAMIADDLKAAGACVLHIMGAGKLFEHPYTSAATVRDGRLIYGPAPAE